MARIKKVCFGRLVEKQLRKQGYEIEGRPVQHGYQIRFEDGLVLNVFDKGSVQWQGRQSEHDESIGLLIEDVRAAMFGPGIFGRK